MGSSYLKPTRDRSGSSRPHDAGADSPPHSTSARLVAWVAVAALLLLQIGLLRGGMARSLHGSTDFRAFYATGRLLALHRSQDMYNLARQADAQHKWISSNDQTLPFLYPAFTALLFVPFGYLSFKAAFLAFASVNLAILVLITRWVAKEFDVQSPGASWPAFALAFGSVSTAMALLQGQITYLLLAIFIGALVLARRKHGTLAGIVLSLLIAKFQLAIPIGLLLFAWKRWDLVRGMLWGMMALGLVSIMVAGPTGTMEYVRMMSGLTQATAVDPVGAKAMYGMFPSDMPNIHGVSYVLARGSHISLLITILVSGGLMLWAARRDRGLPAALCVAMLVSYHFQAYDMTLLLIPLAVSLGEIIRKRRDLRPARLIHLPRTFWGDVGFVAVPAGLLIAPMGAAIVYNRISWLFFAATVAVLVSLSSRSTCAV